jgi:hypothetical protein
MTKQIALLISRLVHPLVILTFFVFYSNLKIQESSRALATIAAMIGLTIVPLTLWNWLKLKQGVYQNFDVSVREQRYSMFGFVFFLAGLLIAYLYLSEQPREIRLGSLLMIQVIVLTFLLNFRLKSSLHLAVCSYIALGLVPLNPTWSVVLAAAIPLLAWSRVHLGRHRWIEVATGTFIGAFTGVQLLYQLDFL